MPPPEPTSDPHRAGALTVEVARQSARETPEVLEALVGHLRHRFGESLSAVLMYGSCLHGGDPTDGIVDLYALVDDYRGAYPERHLRLFNALLPPNVFYVEVRQGDLTVRAKYAVLTERQFLLGATRWYHSYVWARFAQPSRVLWTRDARTLDSVHEAISGAVRTFLARALPTMAGETVDAEEIWSRALALTYASELRPEKASRVRYLVERNLADYARLTAAAAPALGGRLRPLPGDRYEVALAPGARRSAAFAWAVRRWQGRVLSVLRLGKSVFTFAGGVDYAVWKIERHTGIRVEVTPRVRRHPILMGPWILWTLLRRGALR